ncbi:phage regulatory CII family protein [Pseudomonas boanensis]|uniref:phage regulatory CII family protein n=1 Tax=Metapseudomonas boanensis TaxID=2822138 RepID=UPI0035D48DC4
MEAFLRMIHEAVKEEGAKTFYAKAGFKTQIGLLQHTNPDDESHNLKLTNFLLILENLPEQSRYRVLRELVASFGYELDGKDKVEAQSLTSALLHMSAEVADVTRACADALEDKRISQTEKALIRREIGHARASLDVLEASVKVA